MSAWGTESCALRATHTWVSPRCWWSWRSLRWTQGSDFSYWLQRAACLGHSAAGLPQQLLPHPIPLAHSLLSLESGPAFLFFGEKKTPVHCKCKENYILTYG